MWQLTKTCIFLFLSSPKSLCQVQLTSCFYGWSWIEWSTMYLKLFQTRMNIASKSLKLKCSLYWRQHNVSLYIISANCCYKIFFNAFTLNFTLNSKICCKWQRPDLYIIRLYCIFYYVPDELSNFKPILCYYHSLKEYPYITVILFL